MKERVELLDREGLAKAILYPTHRPPVGSRTDGPRAVGGVLPRVQPMDRRLLPRFRRPIDPHRAPVAGRSRRGGGRARARRRATAAAAPSCAPSTITRVPHGRSPARPAVFAAAQDLDVPLAIHPDVRATRVGHSSSATTSSAGRCGTSTSPSPARASSTRSRRFFQLGVFLRFPRLLARRPRVAGRLDRLLPRPRRRDLLRHHAGRHGSAWRSRRRTTSSRQCYISADPDERTIAALMPLVGEDKFFWAPATIPIPTTRATTWRSSAT